ncbi:hypothetical protein BV25DRAFT_1819004 [Artomyces pyxidatus]|uniref:Uncharacterized protein n=1 Tax=Artomyces pyxidatus TaxID=48021 RepID=A0ACB8TGT3_9AGAM|nr:hypothetical protein BV25DRAFT_1819004 [Artomyces pyxidatus]
MAPATRSRDKARTTTTTAKKKSTVYVLIDKTQRNRGEETKSTTRHVKKSAATAKAKAKSKRPTKEPTPVPDEVEEPQQEPVETVPEMPALSLAGPSWGLVTPPPAPPMHSPPDTPTIPEGAVFDGPPPQFALQTPSPNEARQRRRSGLQPRLLSSLPPSSPILYMSSPVTPKANHTAMGTGFSVYYGTGGVLPVPEAAFQTPTRKPRRTRQTEEDLFAEGVVDEKDERAERESIGWENAGSDKENDVASGSLRQGEENPLGFEHHLGSEDGFPTPHDPVHRGILQPLAASSSPARLSEEPGDDPFGILAAERRLKERKRLAAQVDSEPVAGPSRLPAVRQPFGHRDFTDLNPAVSSALPFPTSPALPSHLPRSSPEVPRYSDDSIEDLYATPPKGYVVHTPRKRKTPDDVETPIAVAATTPMTPRHANGREVTMRKRRRKGVDMSFEDIEAMHPSSTTSSPSPVKRRVVREEKQATPLKRLREKGKGKENAKKSKLPDDPAAAAQELEDLVPRMRSRRTVGVRRVAPVESEDEESDEEESEDEVRGKGKKRAARGRSATRGVGRGRGRGRGRGKGKSTESSRGRKKKGDESTPEEIREKREHDRLERAEYFKKLDGYKLSKENVYVV